MVELSIMLSKKELRKKILKIVSSQTEKQITTNSKIISQKLLALPIVKKSKSFFIYVSFGKEVKTHEIINKLINNGKTVTVPKILKPGIMTAVEISSQKQLVLGKFNILEPLSSKPYEKKIDVGIIPCVAVSPTNIRLGRGGGYYDRFLKQHGEMYNIALAYDFQMVERIPSETHDQKIDLIISN